MSLLFFAYANQINDPLPALREEDDQVYSLLSRRIASRDFAIHRDSYATLPKIAEYLIRYRDQLVLFHFSGHAGRDILLLEDGQAGAEGIADLLGLCPQLKLVVLNGCATRGQAGRLLQLPNAPAVIATSAPVGDLTAKQFAISFYQAISEQNATVEEAFQSGLAAALAASVGAIEADNARGLNLRGAATDALWGLQVPDTAPLAKNWKLPRPTIQDIAVAGAVQPNQLLLKSLLESLAPYDEKVREAAKPKTPALIIPGQSAKTTDDRERKNAILQCLPFPLSVHLQKLMAKRRAGMESHDFYDEFTQKRFEQLIHTYHAVVELPAFILLSQYWDILENLQQKPPADEIVIQQIKDYLKTPMNQRLRSLYFPLLKSLIRYFQQHNIPLFIEELAALPLDAGSDYANACAALQLQKERPGVPADGNWTLACIEAEEQLAVVLKNLSFLAAYSLISVRNIDVLRNRQMRKPNYLHRLVRLVQYLSEDPAEDVELLDNFLDNASVLLMKKTAEYSGSRYINLTPFVIDENAYIEKSDDHKLYYYSGFDETQRTAFFQHIYKPQDAPLRAVADNHLALLVAQLELFEAMLSQQPTPAP